VILTIANYRRKETTFSYDFQLHHCEMYQLGSATSSRIMDVDDGHFEATVNNRVLSVTANKRIHFTAPSRNDRDLAALLNLLAPTLTGMLMRSLVYEGTMRMLEDFNARSADAQQSRERPANAGCRVK
jgi:hypothetical protein